MKRNQYAALAKSSRSAGFVMAYILVSIAMLSALVALTAKIRATDANIQKVATISDSLVSQANLIRAKMTECLARYPEGDNGDPLVPTYRRPFPAQPASGLVKDAVCPGNGAVLWSSRDGSYAPTAPIGFAPWQMRHDGTSLRIMIVQTETGYGYTGGASSAATRLGAQASVSAGILTLKIAE